MAALDDLLRDGPDALVELYRLAEDDILRDMARRVSEYDFFIPAARFQKEKLEAMGLVWQEILRRLSALTGRTQEELTALWREAAALAAQEHLAVYQAGGVYHADRIDRKALDGVLRGGLRQTAGIFRNLTQTTARTGAAQFADVMDRAWLQVSSGAFDRQSAVRMAVKELAQKGLRAVRYDSGHADYLETAVRRAVVTGLNQSTLRMQEALADQMGCDLVEVSAHSGARPSHAVWQGRVFSRSGKDKRYPNFVSETGYGTGAGLGGWNCRHRWYPYVEGTPRRMTDAQLQALEKPAYTYRGEEMTAYQAEQKQRYFERQIRRWKREYLACREIGDDTAEAAAKLRSWRGQLAAFLNETGLKRRSAREQVEGFGRSEAAKAAAQAKRFTKAEEYDILVSELKATGAIQKTAEVHIPPRKADTAQTLFDDAHVNGERGHNVAPDEAKAWIEAAKISATVWNGQFERYYSEEGAAYVCQRSNTIRTAYSKKEYDENTKAMMEVLRKHGY